MFGLAIENLMLAHWLAGVIQLIIALGFLVLLIRNIQQVRCDTDGGCSNGCSLTNWIGKLFPKKDKN